MIYVVLFVLLAAALFLPLMTPEPKLFDPNRDLFTDLLAARILGKDGQDIGIIYGTSMADIVTTAIAREDVYAVQIPPGNYTWEVQPR